MKVRVLVRLKEGVLDVQGKAIERGLKDLGVDALSDVRVGKLIEFDVKSDDRVKAKGTVEEICKSLLANTVIERFEIQELS